MPSSCFVYQLSIDFSNAFFMLAPHMQSVVPGTGLQEPFNDACIDVQRKDTSMKALLVCLYPPRHESVASKMFQVI